MHYGIRCFAGANTAQGFYSCFDSIFTSRKRTFYIKGAPGVGKSGLMKRIAQRQASFGHEISYFHCSSDPDSLDGIIDETLNAAMLDATAPHSYDPLYPGASGTILSLGDSLNETALEGDIKEIASVSKEISDAFQSAAKYLSASLFIRKNAGGETDVLRARKYAEEIASAFENHFFLSRPRRFFLSAHTAKGLIDFSDQFSNVTAIEIETPFGESADLLLRIVLEKACMNGVECTVFLDPIDPEILSALYIPEASMFLTGSSQLHAKHRITGIFENGKDTAEDRELFDLLVQKTHASLEKAKKLHDDLERYYTPRMDFSRLVETEARVLKTLDHMNA
ncbi:MAG: hypothetical protein IJC48_10725 [Clostridia bacterium]|nr:hypothetical protein [Clostridia bacterium]